MAITAVLARCAIWCRLSGYGQNRNATHWCCSRRTSPNRDGDLEKARAASADAAKIRADYESDLEKARIEAAEFAKQAAMEATKKAEAADAKIAKKLADKVGAAEAKLAEAKTSAMANLNDVAAEAAMAAVASLAGIKTSSAQASKTASSIATKLAKQETN